MPSNRRLLSPSGRTESLARGSYNFRKRSLRRSRCEHGGDFGKSYRAFWEHVSKHYSGIYGYPTMLISVRVSLLILADTSCNERGFSEYNRIHSASRSNLKVAKVCNLFAIKFYGPMCIGDFNAEEMYAKWKRIVTESNGTSTSAKRRNLGALFPKVMHEAQSKHAETGDV